MLTEEGREGQRRPFWIGVTFQNPAKSCNPAAPHSWGGAGSLASQPLTPARVEASSQDEANRRPCSYPGSQLSLASA